MFDIDNVFSCKSSLSVLLSHFSQIEDPRDVRRISHPLPEILLLVVCGTICGVLSQIFFRKNFVPQKP